MAVWGKSYLDLFLKVSLPTQLSPGNLPSIDNKPGFTYKIYTTVEGEVYLRQQDIFSRLTKFIDTKVITVDKIHSDDKFSPLMDFHNQAIMEADAENAALIFLSPDFIIADGTLSRLIKLWQKGYRAVMVLTLRLIEETVKEELLNKYYHEKDQALNIQPREMVGLCLKHLHPIEKTYFWGDRFSSFPIHAYWPVNDEGLTARCYYLHPLMVNPIVKYVLPDITIDADYVDLACSNRSLIHVIQDSDELCCFELTNAETHDTNAPQPVAPAKAINYARWATVHANPVFDSLLHHMYFQVPIRIHSGSFTKKWRKVEHRASKIARRVRLWTFLFRRHGSLTNALDFYWATKFKSGSFDFSCFGVKKYWNKYHIDYYDIRSEIGWGLAETNDSGQKWRWISSDGKSSVFLKLKLNRSYVLKTLIHTALGNSLYKLEVLINEQPATQQNIISQGKQIWHHCILPRRIDSEEIILTFRCNSPETGDRLALSYSNIKLLQYSIGAVYGEFKKRFRNLVKSVLGYSKASDKGNR